MILSLSVDRFSAITLGFTMGVINSAFIGCHDAVEFTNTFMIISLICKEDSLDKFDFNFLLKYFLFNLFHLGNNLLQFICLKYAFFYLVSKNDIFLS